MDIVLYMGFSILEVCAMFYMIFRIFKIDIMVKEFIFASTIMAFISYVLRAEYQLPYVDVMIQASLMLSFMWMLFRIHIFYATILTGMAYQIYMLIQTMYYFLGSSRYWVGNCHFHRMLTPSACLQNLIGKRSPQGKRLTAPFAHEAGSQGGKGLLCSACPERRQS